MKKMILTVAALLLASIVPLWAQKYELVILDNGTNETAAYSVNNFGFSTGFEIVSDKFVPSMWSPAGGGTYQFPHIDGTPADGIAYYINDMFDVACTYANGALYDDGIVSGSVVMRYYDYSLGDFAAYYPIGADLGTARCINTNGVISGRYGSNAMLLDAFTADRTVLTNEDSITFSVNGIGNSVGTCRGAGSTGGQANYYPLYVRTNTGSLTTIVGPQFGGYNVRAMSINNSNQVVGTSRYWEDPRIVPHGFYWEPETGVSATFESGSFCYGINDKRVIVGILEGRAVMWQKTNGVFVTTDLNSLVKETNYTMVKAFGINNRGQIVGQCLDKKAKVYRAFMLTPKTSARPKLEKVGSDLKLSWPSKVDHLYKIRTSTDLKNWDPIPSYYWADATNSFVTVTIDQPKAFFTVEDLTPD